MDSDKATDSSKYAYPHSFMPDMRTKTQHHATSCASESRCALALTAVMGWPWL